MTTTTDTRTSTTDPAAQGRAFARNPLGSASATSDTADTSTGTGTSGAPASGEEQEGWWDRIKGFFNTFRNSGGIGSTIGGLLGLGGAWLAGNFFGGGIISTILMVALAIPMMLIGSDSIGGWINDWLGNSNGGAASDAPSRSQSRGPEVARTREELEQKMSIISDELEAYNRVAARRVAAGQLSGVTLDSLQRAQAIVRQTLETVRSGIPEASSAAQIAQLDQVLNGVGRGLDATLRAKPELQTEIRTEFNAIRAGRSSGAGGAATSSASTATSLTLTNEELVAMVGPQNGQPDNNLRDRVNIFVDPADPTRRLQVLPVADSVPDGAGIITLAALRDTVGSQTSGIVFGQALNGVVSVQAAPMRNMPISSTGQGRQ